MSLIINHNLSAINTQRNLSGSASSMAKSIEKLSSGYKINVGGDDPSGLIISEQLRSQISGLERAVRNSSEAFNLIGIAEGALNEMNTILKKMRALAIHAANSGVTSPEQVAADQSEMDSGIETLNRIANTTRYSDQYLLNGQKQLVYDVTTVVNEPTDHSLLDTKMTRIDQVFKRDGVKMSVGFSGEKNQYQANTDTSAQRAYLEADNAYSLCEIDGANVTANQEFILTGTSGSRLFSFAQGAHVGTIVENINNVRDSTGIGAALTFASDVRIDQTTNGTPDGSSPDYRNNKAAEPMTGFDDGTYIYQSGDVQIYGAGLNNVSTAKISEFALTPDAASSFKVGFNTDGDGKIYAKVVDKSTNSIEYYKDRDCTMLIGKGDDSFFAASNNSGIPSSPTQNLDGIFLKLNKDNAADLDVYEIAVIGQRLDNQKDMDVDLAGWSDTDNSVMSGVNLGVNTDPEGGLFFDYLPVQFEADGTTVKTFRVNVYMHPSREPKYLVATSGDVENNVKVEQRDAFGNITQIAGQTVRVESVIMDDGADSGLNFTMNLPKPSDLVGATGLTVDEIKASDAYKAVMEEMGKVKSEYAEISDEYLSAKATRDTAVADLETANKALDEARKKEEKVRREIDRLEARGIDQQLLDATRDLALAENDITDAARSAIADKTLLDSYTNVTVALPGAPEKIAEQMAGAIMDEITASLARGDNPVEDIDWANSAKVVPPALTKKDEMIAAVWNLSPLNTLTADERAALKVDADKLLSDAYDAATDIDLIKEVSEYSQQVTDLGTLETRYQNALDDLNDAEADFDVAITKAVERTADDWGIKVPDTDIADVADALLAAIQEHIDGPALNDGAASDPTIDFLRYGWAKGDIKSDIVAAAVDAIDGGAIGSLTNASADRLEALVSDMYDTLTQDGFTELTAYGEARQDVLAATKELADNPAPNMAADFAADITTKLQDSAEVLEGKVTPADVNMTKVEAWLTANGQSWDDMAAEIATVIQTTISAGGGVFPAKMTYTDADIGILLATIQTNVKAATTPILDDMYNNATATNGLSGVNAAGDEPIIDDLVARLWAASTGTGSSIREYLEENKAFNDATDDLVDANTAMAGAATTDLGDGVTAGTPTYSAAQDAILSLGSIETATLSPGIGATDPLEQAIADSMQEQLLNLAREGFDITDAAAMGAGNVRDVMIAGIIKSLPLSVIADAPTSAIGTATLKQFVSEAYDNYVNNTDPAGGLLEPVGTDGYFDSYTKLADVYAALEEIYPGGGSIQRAEDRLERYAQNIEDAPLRKAQTSASTRKAWERLVEDYGGTTDADLTKLAEDFGAYVRKLVEDAATAGTEDDIIWNSEDVNNPAVDVYDWLRDKVSGAPGLPIYNTINAALRVDPNDPAAKAALADLNKVVDKMFTAVTNPEQIGDVGELENPPANVEVGDYVPRSPVQKYFDQNDKLKALQAELELKEGEKEALDDVITDLMDQVTLPNGDLVLDLHDASQEFGIISQEAEPLLDEIASLETQAKEMLAKAGGGKVLMPKGNQGGGITFTNLGLRLYSVDYGSAETIRIQNKAGNLFYQYREPDSMEKLMVEPDKTVQVAGQDAQISLNGAPIFTTGLVADTTTPDFSGSLVFNAGTLGETTLAVAGYDTGKLFSKATSLQGVEENEAEIVELRRHFEPPAMSVPMGDEVAMKGMLNENGKPVNLYMDFSQLDPSVEVKIDNFNNACPIEATFVEPDQLTINANSLGTDPDNQMTITVKVNPDDMRNGYYVTDPALKGLFIRTDNLVDLNRSGGEYTPPVAPTTTPGAGETMLEVSTYATNPRSNTSESMENFLGGMQFQLGNTEGDQDRTVYSIQSMAMSELGRISWNGTEYCLQNVLGGGLASLTKDPILAMRVLEQAVDDVSTLRARLGAFQSNMLQSNINSLGVAIENITKTESAIRDTDMAAESTEFTRFQIMQQAGTSMLAQANQTSQNVLSLLQG